MFEVVVIGGGPSGVTAALRARELGATVALIEREHMGGVCTNDGCVPTRVLARAARLMRDTEQFADYGLEGEPPTVDFVRLLNRTEHVVHKVHQKKQLRAHIEAADVRVFDGIGDARFLDSHTLSLGNESSVQGEKFILCVGGHARRIPLPGSEHALTHSDVWTMKGLPESVAVVGGAATGCQLASVFAAFGSRVRLLEVSPRILAAEDEAVSEAVAEAFGRRGIEIVTGIGGVEKVDRENGAYDAGAERHQRGESRRRTNRAWRGTWLQAHYRAARRLHRPRVRQRGPHRKSGSQRRTRLRRGGCTLCGTGSRRRRRAHRGHVQASRGPRVAAHPGRSHRGGAGRGGRSDRGDGDAGRDACGTVGGCRVRLPHLHSHSGYSGSPNPPRTWPGGRLAAVGYTRTYSRGGVGTQRPRMKAGWGRLEPSKTRAGQQVSTPPCR